MKIEKKVLNEALKVLGKVVCQTSPVELYQMIRFVGNADGVKAMATDGIETVTVKLDATLRVELFYTPSIPPKISHILNDAKNTYKLTKIQ